MGFLGSLRGKKTDSVKDSYVESCFDFDFKEVPDHRDMREIPSISEIFSKEMQAAFSGNRESCSRAIPLIESELKNYSDYDLLYCWLGFCKKTLYGNGEARKTYLEGLEKSRLRGTLCGALGMLAFEENNLSEAAKWWIRSCATQASSGNYESASPFLNLATIAKYLNLKNCHSKLLRRSLSIQEMAFNPSAELQRASMVQQQGNDSITHAIERLCKNYIAN